MLSTTNPRNNTKTNPRKNTKTNPRNNSKTNPRKNSKTNPRNNSKTNPRKNSKTNQFKNSKTNPRKNSKTNPRNNKTGNQIKSLPKEIKTDNIKISKVELRKIVKALFSNMNTDDNETIRIIRNLGKDEKSVTQLTKLINKTKEDEVKVSADIITNMNSIKETILTLYKQFDKLNNDLSDLFERKKLQ